MTPNTHNGPEADRQKTPVEATTSISAPQRRVSDMKIVGARWKQPLKAFGVELALVSIQLLLERLTKHIAGGENPRSQPASHDPNVQESNGSMDSILDKFDSVVNGNAGSR